MYSFKSIRRILLYNKCKYLFKGIVHEILIFQGIKVFYSDGLSLSCFPAAEILLCQFCTETSIISFQNIDHWWHCHLCMEDHLNFSLVHLILRLETFFYFKYIAEVIAPNIKVTASGFKDIGKLKTIAWGADINVILNIIEANYRNRKYKIKKYTFRSNLYIFS